MFIFSKSNRDYELRVSLSVSTTPERSEKINELMTEYGINQSQIANMLFDFALTTIDKIKEREPDFVLGKPGQMTTIAEEVMYDQNFVRNDKPNPFLIEKLIDDTLEGDYTDDERRNIFEKAITEFEMYTQKLKNILKYEGKNEIVS